MIDQRALALAGCILLLPTVALATNPGLTPHDVAEMRNVGEAAIAPSGDAIAYTLNVPRPPGDGDDGPAWRELHVLLGDGASLPFITGEANVRQVGWTPDGAHITFVSKRGDDEHNGLYVIPRRGGEARLAASLPNGVNAYKLCSDGQSLALIGAEKKDDDAEEWADKGFDQNIYEENLQYSRLWIATLGEDGEADVPDEPLALEGSVMAAAWSPGCDRLAVSAARSPLVDDTLMQTRIQVVGKDGGSVVKIANPGKLGRVEFSPDGKNLAMISAEDLHDPREGRLMVVPADGGELRDLLPGLLGHIQDFAWESNGKLTYLVHEGVEARLGSVGLDGKDSTRLEPGGPIFTAFDRAASGAMALVASTPTHPAELFRLDGTLERKTDSNPWLAERRLAPQEVVRHTARDGLELEGLLVRPLDEKKGQRYPLILVVHGGPEAHHSNDWLTAYHRPAQTGAAQGFAVFYPNYRASTGRGVEFSKLDHGDPAGKQFDDLVDAVDHLVEMGLVDKDKVGITGGSYGGYASAWGATYYSERFAAAVMSVGISEKIAKFGTSDIPNELFLVHERHWPWDDFQMALERSPVYYVKKAKTPILITHGQKDTRVFPGQSMILYRFLKTIGQTPVRLVLYPNEGHGNRNAAARLDFSLRQLRWMRHYLQDKGRDAEPPAWDVDYGLDTEDEDEDEDSD